MAPGIASAGIISQGTTSLDGVPGVGVLFEPMLHRVSQQGYLKSTMQVSSPQRPPRGIHTLHLYLVGLHPTLRRPSPSPTARDPNTASPPFAPPVSRSWRRLRRCNSFSGLTSSKTPRLHVSSLSIGRRRTALHHPWFRWRSCNPSLSRLCCGSCKTKACMLVEAVSFQLKIRL